jgi:hypothetical protein
MKIYKHVILRSTSKSQINLPKDVWSELGWNINDKLKLQFSYNSPYEDQEPVSLYIERVDND